MQGICLVFVNSSSKTLNQGNNNDNDNDNDSDNDNIHVYISVNYIVYCYNTTEATTHYFSKLMTEIVSPNSHPNCKSNSPLHLLIYTSMV